MFGKINFVPICAPFPKHFWQILILIIKSTILHRKPVFYLKEKSTDMDVVRQNAGK